MTAIVHPTVATLAPLTIATFCLSMVSSELLASQAVINWAKTAIPWGLLPLLPALAVAGGSAFALGRGRRGACEKRRRNAGGLLRRMASCSSSRLRCSSRRRRNLADSMPRSICSRLWNSLPGQRISFFPGEICATVVDCKADFACRPGCFALTRAATSPSRTGENERLRQAKSLQYHGIHPIDCLGSSSPPDKRVERWRCPSRESERS